MILILKSRDPNKHPFKPTPNHMVYWTHLIEVIRPRNGMRLVEADEVSVDTETGVYTVHWHDTLLPDTYQG